MVDITLQIMLEPATHDLSYDPEKAARRYRQDDIFEIHRSTDIATFDGTKYRLPSIGTKVFGYIHILSVPDALAQKLQTALISTTGERSINLFPDPETGENTFYDDPYRRRKWTMPRGLMDSGDKAELLADREVTVAWPQAKPMIRRKAVNVRIDASQDSEANSLQDSDL